MINAAAVPTSTSSNTGGSPMPPLPGIPGKSADSSVTPTVTMPSTPPSVASSLHSTVVPPQVLPSHSAPHVSPARPLNAPHQDIAGLHKSLADKISDPTKTDTVEPKVTGSAGMPPTSPTQPSLQQPTIDMPVTPPPKKGMSGKLLIGIGLFLLTLIGGGVTYYLQTQNQDTRQQAAFYQYNIDGLSNTGLVVDVPPGPDTWFGYLGNGQYSDYKPAVGGDGVNDPNSYYDVSKGETVTFSVPLKNTHEGHRGRRYRFYVFKINQADANNNNNWDDDLAVTPDYPQGEKAIFYIHARGDKGTSDGTRQSQVYDGGWQTFSIEPGTTGKVSGSWKPSNNDCGMYQMDIFLDDGTPDGGLSNYSNIAGAGFIRVKGCAQSSVKVAGSVVCYAGGKKYAVQNVTVNVGDKNYTTGANGIYTTDGSAAGSWIASRLTLPDTFNIQEYDANNNPTGPVLQGSKAALTVLGGTQVINAFNGCSADFMNSNCGGIYDNPDPGDSNDRVAQCLRAPTRDGAKAPGSYEWCNLQGGTAQRNGFDFAIYNCYAPPPAETVGSCDSLTGPTTGTVGDVLAFNLKTTNVTVSSLHYTTTKVNYCPVSGTTPWGEITKSATTGVFTWNTAGLAPGTYYITAMAKLSSTKTCCTNLLTDQYPSGFENCQQCGKTITLTAPPVTPPTPGACNAECYSDGGCTQNATNTMRCWGASTTETLRCRDNRYPTEPTCQPPAPPQVGCNELCSSDQECEQYEGKEIRCLQTAEGDHRCRNTAYPSQSSCAPPVTGGMCVGLCAVASTSGSAADMSQCSTGGFLSRPKLNEYLHMKCNATGSYSQVNVWVQAESTGTRTKVNTGNELTGVYKIAAADTYSFGCEIQ